MAPVALGRRRHLQQLELDLTHPAGASRVADVEAAAVCAYLADAFPKAGLAPALDDPRRGTYLRWLFFAAACGEAALTDKSSPRNNPPPSRSLGYGSYDPPGNRWLVPGVRSMVNLVLARRFDHPAWRELWQDAGTVKVRAGLRGSTE